MEEEFLLFHLLFVSGDKKSPPDGFGEPIDTLRMLWYIIALERAARPSGCSRPGTPTRQSLVPGFFYPIIDRLPYITGPNFACSNPFYIFIIPSSPVKLN